MRVGAADAERADAGPPRLPFAGHSVSVGVDVERAVGEVDLRVGLLESAGSAGSAGA